MWAIAPLPAAPRRGAAGLRSRARGAFARKGRYHADVTPSVPEATLYVLGIRADTGGLAYETTTARDADALAWLLRKGASQAAIAEFGVERISGDQRKILATALRTVESRLYRGVGVATVAVRSKGYVPGLAAVVEELLELTAADVLWITRGGCGVAGRSATYL